MLNWDSTRRDGRTTISAMTDTIRGEIIAEDAECIVIKTKDKNICVKRGTWKYHDLRGISGYFVICDGRLVDWI